VGGVAGHLREEARRTGIGIRIWNQLFDSTRAVHEARGSGEITKNISGVAEAAQSTSRGAGDSQKAAHELAKMSGELKDLTAKFKF
jgi:methyl-accepting chemotaxis protein